MSAVTTVRSRYSTPADTAARTKWCADEVVVHVGAQPVVVGDVVVWARGDEQPLRPRAVRDEGAPGVVAIECEPALQPAAQLGEASEPAAVCREIVAVIQPPPVAPRQALQGEICEWRTRFADREPRVGAPLQQDDVVSLDCEDAREQ